MTLIYATCDVGLYISKDSGNTWTLKLPGSNYTHVTCGLYGDVVAVIKSGEGIFVSNDGGNTWNKTLTSTSTMWTDIDCDYQCKNIVACMKGGSLYVSNDFGVTFKTRGLITKWLSVTVDYYNGSIMYAGSESYLYYSSTNGISWNLKATIPYFTKALYFASLDCFDSGSDVFACVQRYTDNRSAVIRSTNSGVTWSTPDFNSNGTFCYGTSLVGVPGNPGGYVISTSSSVATNSPGYTQTVGGAFKFILELKGVTALWCSSDLKYIIYGKKQGGILYKSQDNGLTFVALQ